MSEADLEPDWETTLTVTLTPAAIAHALFGSAPQAHTGWETCVDPELVVAELSAVDERNGNHCRLVQQEYEEDGNDATFHDWAVELKLGDIIIVGHWRTAVGGSGAEWDWCVNEAERAFAHGCLLIGKRVLRGMVIDDMPSQPPVTRH
jgi:hypothetical protein